MIHVLATDGGYQEFTLGGAEYFWLVDSALTALLAAPGTGLTQTART